MVAALRPAFAPLYLRTIRSSRSGVYRCVPIERRRDKTRVSAPILNDPQHGSPRLAATRSALHDGGLSARRSSAGAGHRGPGGCVPARPGDEDEPATAQPRCRRIRRSD